MQTPTRTVHIVPHFHHDVAYLASESECLRLAIPNLVRALDLLDEYPDYRFMVEQVYLLEQLLFRRPGERERLREHLESGRLDISCGMYVMPDLNLISGESIVGQIRIGREVARSLDLPPLDGRVRVLWISDCWGHPFQMPQIAQGCGYTAYAFCRGMLRRNDAEDEPLLPSEFIWDGAADSSVLGLWLPEGYGPVPFMPEWAGDNGPPGALAVIERIAENVGRYSSVPVILLGNGGDNAEPQAIILGVCKDSDRVRVSTPTLYADEVFRYSDRLHHFSGEFNPLFHGTYSARIPLKQRNRQLEHLLETVRRYRAAIGDLRTSTGEQVRHAERLLAKQQVHDVIAGSICDDVYRAAMREFEEAEEILLSAGKLVTRNVLPGLDEQHWFNPSAFARTEVVDTRWRCDGVILADGAPLPVQQTFDGRALVKVTIPPLSTVTLRPANGSPQPETDLRVLGESIENRFWRVKLSPAGGIASVTSKATGEEFVDAGRCDWNTLVFQWDMGDIYMHDAQPLDTRARASWFARPHIDPLPPPRSQTLNQTAAQYSTHEDCTVELLERGPLRVLLRVTGTIRMWRVQVQFAQYVALYAGEPRIDFHTEILPAGKHYRLRAAFPTTVRNGRCRHEVAFGQTERSEGEYPALHWIDYRDRTHGVCMINYGLPGNAICEDVLLLSLFRSVALEYKCDSDMAFGSQARHWFDYAVLPIDGVAPDHPVQAGEQVNRPLCPVQQQTLGNAPRLESDSVVLSFWDGRTVRLFEPDGRRTTAVLGLPRTAGETPRQCEETDLLGRPLRSLPVENGEVRLEFAPFQVRTLRFS